MYYFQDYDNDQDLKSSMTKRLNQDHCTELARDDVTTKHTTLSTAKDVVSDLMLNAVLTPRRMLQKTSLIAKINLWNNSFQNMYDML